MDFQAEDAINWFSKMTNKVVINKQYLTALDTQIGDGDHGDNIAKGFTAVSKLLHHAKKEDITTTAQVFRRSAMVLLMTVSGASGILYATAFLRMASVFENKNRIDHSAFTEAISEAVEGIKERGNVEYGEKTLLDVWIDLVELFQSSEEFPQASLIEQSARRAMNKTKTSIAMKGKAALYEEHSLGHIDPGAASTYYFFASLAEVCEEKQNGRIC